MNHIYVRKSEILKKEIIENIKGNLFNKKKAIEEGLSKIISPNGNIPVKYKNKKYVYNIRVNRLFPDLKNYDFYSLNLNEKNSEDIKNIFSEEFKEFEDMEILSEEIFRKVFYREKDRYIEQGKILNTNNIIENYIIEKDGSLVIFNSQAEKIETKEGTLIPIIKISDIEDNNESKKELESIIKIFEENEIEILFNDIDKRYKEKYDELVELYNDIEKYNFSEDNSDYDKKEILKAFEEDKLDLPLNFIDEYLEKLKNIEKSRLDEKEYDEKIFTDYQKGNWDIFSDSKEDVDNRELIKIKTNEKYYERDPKNDVKDGGIVAIDFGTKSTVVAIQTQNEKTSLVRIAGGSYKKNVEKSQFENPTIMEFIDIESFEKAYNESKGRPFTEWDDLKISYAANSSFIGGSKFVLEGLKQWAGNKDEKLVIYDKKWKRIDLKPYIDVEEDEFDPIEYYAYYIGSYINNMFTGNIFTKYLLSFPIKYENEIRVKILKSFEKGIKKSLPTSILENEKIMDNFQVYRGANEPTAYFLCAGKELDKFPKKENEKLFYGIFDFGGGTTDFSFGICKYIGLTSSRYDYEIKHFGEGGDKFLGGENILKNLAFEICKNNLAILKEKDIHFYCPVGCKEFNGYEGVLDNSYEAIYNIKQIAEKFRGFWEEDEFSKDLYSSDEIGVTLLSSKDSSEIINLKYDKTKCEDIIDSILRKGIENFISSLKLLFKNENLGVDKMEIFLSGNSSKSKRFQKMFEEEIQKIEDTVKSKDEKIFTINYPIEKLGNKDGLEVNAKTGTAIGLLESRKGGKFKIIAKDEEVNDNEINFRYYVGYLKNSKFKPVLDYKVGYDNWVKFLDASDIETEIYYTHQANSIEGGISGDNSNLDRKIITISKDYQDEDTYIFIRATKPDIIEYCVSTEKKIKKNEFIEEAQELKLI
ncbi:hypothetical protein [Fusobacterium periodonticum]|uniref:Molecular chaperone DnaK n=2 Tax=Fusobacterium periodonticum TaxID=860 RepID=A0AAD0HVX4_9FUSO|nr:hypothetical protein [Fusobacterium periodonticum]AVQ25963.1 hypothetical protein C4N17_10105 [Fusobacterium periodonticum]KGE61660.1 hypothetical protein FSAG_002256 [Fusobacterium periodonticum 2_1_31]